MLRLWRLLAYAVREALDFRRVRWILQRGLRGYADCDLWSYGTYSAERDARALRDFMRHPGGVPSGLCGEDGSRPFDAAMAEWQGILETIASGLESGQHAAWNCDCVHADGAALRMHAELHHERFRRAHELLADWQLGIWR